MGCKTSSPRSEVVKAESEDLLRVELGDDGLDVSKETSLTTDPARASSHASTESMDLVDKLKSFHSMDLVDKDFPELDGVPPVRSTHASYVAELDHFLSDVNGEKLQWSVRQKLRIHSWKQHHVRFSPTPDASCGASSASRGKRIIVSV
ncbi:unnamed protein product [Durusdinium trenchii]|uniref:Uncharacterized protein n=1 Tax=Durusdinium trenchii TaxID=1381693 RepID=A0ABP0Q0J0_9DINO